MAGLVDHVTLTSGYPVLNADWLISMGAICCQRNTLPSTRAISIFQQIIWYWKKVSIVFQIEIPRANYSRIHNFTIAALHIRAHHAQRWSITKSVYSTSTCTAMVGLMDHVTLRSGYPILNADWLILIAAIICCQRNTSPGASAISIYQEII